MQPSSLGKQLVILSILFLSCFHSYSQCNQVLPDITQCDMENVDFDMNGDPDGIINIYTETGTTVGEGSWFIDPQYASAFDSGTGNLSMWALQNSTTTINQNEYSFELRNATCGTDPFKRVRLILGPYSGTALPPSGPLNVNAQGCSEGGFDLFNAFALNDEIPSPHLNGEWTYTGTSSSFIGINSGSVLIVDIPYQSGLPLVDQEVFELTYTVPGDAALGCAAFQQTTVRIAMVRQVDPGVPIPVDICEKEILAGNYDTEIDLTDDLYLTGEDTEGIWLHLLDTSGEQDDAQDSMINVRTIYDNLIDGGNNLRFGCEKYEFTYSVKQRSAVCLDKETTISLTLYEELRPFSQPNPPPKICRNEIAGGVNLFDLLEFTTEGSFDFIYSDDYYVNWRLVSSPDGNDLGVSTQPFAVIVPRPADTRYLGSVSTFMAPAGVYVFEYGVSPKINCQEQPEICNPFALLGEIHYCEHPCEVITTQVTIEILEFEYAGENTTVNLCETVNQVDLRSLLNTNGNTIATTGVWRDGMGDVVSNTFVFPAISTAQTFNFTYSTETSEGCIDSATLELIVSALPNAGDDGAITMCSDDLTVTLFDLLSGDPDTTGSWTGPFGYDSDGDHLAVFDVSDAMLPVLGEGIYTYTVPSNAGCSSPDESIVTISIVSPVTIGNDRSETFCKLDGRVNLYSLLDRDTPRDGIFEDTDNTLALDAEGVLEFETLTNNIYDFRYVITNTLPCDESSLTVSVQIVDLPIPNVPTQEFCILDAKRLEDIEVDVLNYNWYDTLESETPIIDNPLLFDEQVYYIASVDADNCESERLQVIVLILNTGEKFENGDLCTLDFQDGVSPNGDNQNDTFDLLIDDVYNIPEAFPDFDIKIYNRYGSLVYEGNINTEEFRGGSNVSLSLGDDLPSGTYFYVFTPNFENNLPIQGSFYLSR